MTLMGITTSASANNNKTIITAQAALRPNEGELLVMASAATLFITSAPDPRFIRGYKLPQQQAVCSRQRSVNAFAAHCLLPALLMGG
jgi:hypothetical protein